MCREKWVTEELLKYGLIYKQGNISNLEEKMLVECLYCGEERYVLFKSRKKYGCRKKSVEEIRNKSATELNSKIENLGYKLIHLGNYENSTATKLIVECSKGHKRETTYKNLLHRPNCFECSRDDSFIKKREEIKIKLSNLGYTVIDIQAKKYGSNTQYIIKANCQHGHVFNKLYSTYTSECLLCNPNRLWNFQSINVWITENRPNLSLLYYDIASKRASFKCIKDGYTFTTDFAKFRSADSDCPKCSKSAKLTREEVIQIYSKKGYKIDIGDKVTARDKIPTTCNEGHTYLSNIIRFRDRGDICPECQRKNQASRGEKEFADWLISLGYNVISNDRSVLGGLEIDCYLPEYKLGIEHNGLYYHSSAISHKTKDMHHRKYIKAVEKNIKLLQFWEDEFIEKLDIIKSMVLTNLKHKSIRRIFARKCVVKEVDKETAKKFLIENHLQGFRGLHRLGLFCDDELVMLLTYGPHHRKKIDGVVLQRLVSKKYTQVIGGLSKLLKHVPRPILTWSDNLYSTGNTYEKVGFKLTKNLYPDYQYFKNLGRLQYKRFSKQSLKKTPEERLTGKTEFQLRTEQKYFRIYDAGKKQWLLL